MTQGYKIHRVVKDISSEFNDNSYDELIPNLASIFNDYTTKLYGQAKDQKN